MTMTVITSEQLHDRGKTLLHIGNDNLKLLQPPFDRFRELTGRFIDEFRPTPFPHGTLGPLIDVLRGWVTHADSAAQAGVIRELLAVLTAADRDGVGVVFDGE
jgi:hypothetical protein